MRTVTYRWSIGLHSSKGPNNAEDVRARVALALSEAGARFADAPGSFPVPGFRALQAFGFWLGEREPAIVIETTQPEPESAEDAADLDVIARALGRGIATALGQACVYVERSEGRGWLVDADCEVTS